MAAPENNPPNDVILRVQVMPNGRFEVRRGDRLLGTSENQMMAVWSAVGAAEQLAKSGQTVRVILNQQGRETEEFVATPSPGQRD